MEQPERRVYIERTDALKGLGLLSNESIDLCITSPPYNMQKDYDEYEDDMPRDDYLRYMGRIAKELGRVMKPNGSVFWNFSGKPSDRWLPHELVHHFRNDFELQNEIHWVKSITVGEETSGQFKPINSPRYVNCQHEYLWHFTRSGDVSLDRLAIGVPYQDDSNARRFKQGSKFGYHCRGNVWHLPYATRQRKAAHPAMFPVELPDSCMRLHGLPPLELRTELLVLDPFCGLGTTGVAAVHLGLKFLGFEISANYCLGAATRIYEETGEKVLVRLNMGATA